MRSAIVLIGLLASAGQTQTQTPPPARSPSLAAALRGATAAVKACSGKPVAIAVTDSLGYPKLIYVPDGTEAWVGDFARRKALAVIRTGLASGEAGERAKNDPAIEAIFSADASLLRFAGGLPLRSGGALIGAFAVAGAGPPAADEACAKVGAAVVTRAR